MSISVACTGQSTHSSILLIPFFSYQENPVPIFIMVAFSKCFQLSLSLLASSVVASPTPVQLESRAAIDSDAVVGFPETVPSGTVGTVYEAYQPYLYVVNGCVPFPAVDASGNTRHDNYLSYSLPT